MKKQSMLVPLGRTLPAIESDIVETHVSEVTVFGRISEADSVRMVIATSARWNSV